MWVSLNCHRCFYRVVDNLLPMQLQTHQSLVLWLQMMNSAVGVLLPHQEVCQLINVETLHDSQECRGNRTITEYSSLHELFMIVACLSFSEFKGV